MFITELMTTTLEILSTTPTTSLPTNESEVENILDESQSDINSTQIVPEVPVQNSTSSNTLAEYRRNGAQMIYIDLLTVLMLLIVCFSFVQ